MTAKDLNVWQIIVHLVNSQPWNAEKLERFFGVSFSSTPASNASFTFWEGKGGYTKDGAYLARVVLALRNQSEHSTGMLNLDLSGTCPTLADLKVQYKDVVLVSQPRGRSVNEETIYRATLPWGDVAFGFADRQPECLSSIGIKPRNPEVQR